MLWVLCTLLNAILHYSIHYSSWYWFNAGLRSPSVQLKVRTSLTFINEAPGMDVQDFLYHLSISQRSFLIKKQTFVLPGICTLQERPVQVDPEALDGINRQQFSVNEDVTWIDFVLLTHILRLDNHFSGFFRCWSRALDGMSRKQIRRKTTGVLGVAVIMISIMTLHSSLFHVSGNFLSSCSRVWN